MKICETRIAALSSALLAVSGPNNYFQADALQPTICGPQ
jgi:hypothetical protein